jgi:PPK2 family polyphosphate:nucleotide phosphotransferase
MGSSENSASRPDRPARPRTEPATDPAETRAAAREATGHAASLTSPERLVADRLPPEPDYPRYRVEPGARIRLAEVDPDQSERFKKKQQVTDELVAQRDRIRNLQARLYAESRQSLLIILQAMDTGGKDGTIRGVFEGVNPQGCQVWSFKAPTRQELEQDFLWRYHAKAPPRGMVTIFNRSHYEDVLIVRVKSIVPEDVWRHRYPMINEFEHLLTLNRTTVLKFFLHISRDEQKRRLESRLADPAKHWKFSSDDIRERAYWDEYMAAYEDAISNCSTAYAPWYVVPANKKWYRNLVIARTIADTLEAMAPQYPPAEAGLESVVVPD